MTISLAIRTEDKYTWILSFFVLIRLFLFHKSNKKLSVKKICPENFTRNIYMYLSMIVELNTKQISANEKYLLFLRRYCHPGMAIINIFATKSVLIMWKDLLFVGIGGGIGSMFRFVTSRIVARFINNEWLFLGTFAANIAGCLLIGLFSGWILAHHPENQSFRLLLIVGFCGGYTTFSAFAFENLRLMEMNQWGLFALYTSASIALGLLAVWGGMKLGHML